MSSTKLTPRGRALRWHTNHTGLTEQPPGSNTDRRKDGIRAAQIKAAVGGGWLVGKAWCGVWALMGALAGGVKVGQPYRWASVAAIEDDARVQRNGFRSWVTGPIRRTGKQWSGVYRGDLVVLFGPGVHVATIRSCARAYRLLGRVRTDEGNTSFEGAPGSQSNGGCSTRRWRRIADIHGIAKVDFPNK